MRLKLSAFLLLTILLSVLLSGCMTSHEFTNIVKSKISNELVSEKKIETNENKQEKKPKKPIFNPD